ncbi:MAG: hypothetical protein LLG01_18590 [Planctomycetaceae bacterium]|nr:hypothetical protein [Planctomycetaceae bacterium]
MSASPRIERGHEEPFAIQFSLFLANRVGQLKDVLNVLEEQNVDVLGLSIVDAADWAVIRMVLSDSSKGRSVLQEHHLPFTESGVLLVALPESDSFSRICSLLLTAEVNVHFAYPLTIRHREAPVMTLHVDDAVLATQTLTHHGFDLLGQEDLRDRL